jgi:hypothetical protein
MSQLPLSSLVFHPFPDSLQLLKFIFALFLLVIGLLLRLPSCQLPVEHSDPVRRLRQVLMSAV